MSDIVERLRACQGVLTHDPECNCEEAADEIERLKAENDKFRRTLEIIAEKSTDQLQRMQAIGTLANIGPKP